MVLARCSHLEVLPSIAIALHRPRKGFHRQLHESKIVVSIQEKANETSEKGKAISHYRHNCQLNARWYVNYI